MREGINKLTTERPQEEGANAAQLTALIAARVAGVGRSHLALVGGTTTAGEVGSEVGDHIVVVADVEAQVTLNNAGEGGSGQVDRVGDGARVSTGLGEVVEVGGLLALEELIELGGVDIGGEGGHVDLEAAVAIEEIGPGTGIVSVRLWLGIEIGIGGGGWIGDVPGGNSDTRVGLLHGDRRRGHRDGDGGQSGDEDGLKGHGVWVCEESRQVVDVFDG